MKKVSNIGLVKLFRFKSALILGKALIFALKLRNSRGTALPGLVTEKFYPGFLKVMRKRIKKLIVITGTNGKTSTQHTLSGLLENLQSGRVLVNSRGANLSRGIVSEGLKSFSIFGNDHFDYAILEVEEATLPKIAQDLFPDYVIVTNFFRDQLDAYGEIDRTKMHVRNALKLLPDAHIIANGDDSQVIDCISLLDNQITLVKIENISNHISYESTGTPQDNATRKNDTIEIIFQEPTINPDLTSNIQFDGENYNFKLPGLHSTYAAFFSLTICKKLGLTTNSQRLKEALGKVKPAFGRGEVINFNSVPLQIFLVKNPVGFDITLDLFCEIKSKFDLVILINDKIADGRDVSWLWDSQIEKLNRLNLITSIHIGGSRRQDMSLRVKYALDSKVGRSVNIEVYDTLPELLQSVQSLKNVKVIATYTAMNQFRDLIVSD